uniref:CSON003743 protein n=1 Tax=Culicoides sonorensis TaxID=179676 RepID=A0A336MRT1_CULSO
MHQMILKNHSDVEINLLVMAKMYSVSAHLYPLFLQKTRLETFTEWLDASIDINILARLGFYYIGGPTHNTKCFYCNAIIGNWENFPNTISEHLRYSYNCPLITGEQTDNQPINSEELNETLNRIRVNYLNTSYHALMNETEFINCLDTFFSKYFYLRKFKHPEFIMASKRLKSFANWPCGLKQKPDELAHSGFFYQNLYDEPFL